MGKRSKVLRFCHYCKLSAPPRFMVPCQIPCGLYFCRKCLTKYYKYSRPKCAKLPSVNWRCPVCTSKCQCEDCQEIATDPCAKNMLEPRERQQETYNYKKVTGDVKECVGKCPSSNSCNNLRYNPGHQSVPNTEQKRLLPKFSGTLEYGFG